MPPCDHDECPPTHCKVLAAATCYAPLAGLIAQLEAAAENAEYWRDKDIRECRERWGGKAAAFHEAISMARQCSHSSMDTCPTSADTEPKEKP
jgi:hypothetical protein